MKKNELLDYLHEFMSPNGIPMYAGKWMNWEKRYYSLPTKREYYKAVSIDSHSLGGIEFMYFPETSLLKVETLRFKCSEIQAERIILSACEGYGVKIMPLYRKGNEKGILV